MTPVDATSTLSSEIPRTFAAPLAVSLQYPNPSAPVHAFAIPEFTITTCANSLSFTISGRSDLKNKRIIAVGRLTKQKGFDFLIEAAVLIREQLPDWHIDIFGSGEDKSDLQAQINSLNLEKFVKINPPTKNIQCELLKSSIYLMTSRWEGLPMILIEAKSCGLPCVSFDCPEGPADIIKHSEDGFLVELGDIKTLVRYVVELATDEKLLNRYSQSAIINSLEFSPTIIFPKWDSIL